MTGAPQYLIVIYLAEQERSPPISPGYVAGELDRSPSAATEMLQRLARKGYVRYDSYEGVTLTPEGRETAVELYENYVTLSRFFREVLALDDYETEAMRLAGTISSTVTNRLASTLLSESEQDPSADGSVRSSSHSDN